MTDQTDRDLRIMAFLDGSMSAEELTRFEAEMESDAALADEVARMMANDDLLKRAFAEPIEQGVDDALLARMGLAEPAQAAIAPAVATPANDNPPFWQRWRMPVGLAMAASLAFVLVLTMRQPDPQSQPTQFAAAMDSLPSGEVVQLASGDELSPVLTFAAADGRYCREFRVQGDSGATGGIACRDDANWAVVALSGEAGDLADMNQITLASGASGESLDEAYDALGASDPFNAERESALIAGGWQPE